MSGTQLQEYYNVSVKDSTNEQALETFIGNLLKGGNAAELKSEWAGLQDKLNYNKCFQRIGAQPFTQALVSAGVYSAQEVNNAYSRNNAPVNTEVKESVTLQGGELQSNLLSATSDAFMDVLQGGGENVSSDTSEAFMELIGGEHQMGEPANMEATGTENLDRIENPIAAVEENTANAKKGFHQQGFRLAVGNNRLTEGDIPKENSLVKLLQQRNTLLMNNSPYPVGIPTAILTGKGFNGGGDLDTSANTPDVMKFLETNPDVNYRRLSSIYTQVRSEVASKTGRPVDSAFDVKVTDLLSNIREQERELRTHLVEMNMVKHMEPHQSGEPWTEISVGAKATEYLKSFYAKNQELNDASLHLVNLLSRVAYNNLGYN